MKISIVCRRRTALLAVPLRATRTRFDPAVFARDRSLTTGSNPLHFVRAHVSIGKPYPILHHQMFESYQSEKSGDYPFRLNARSGQIIGTSQMYASASGLKNGIASVNKDAADAGIRVLG